MIVVFDFDKTLINYDSTLPFFKFCCKNKIRWFIYYIFYFFCKILSKFKILSVKKEKEIGIFFFCPKDFKLFKQKSKEFASMLLLNEIYKNYYLKHKKSGDKIIIASASFEYYLKEIFPDDTVIGTTININNFNKISGIEQHPFKQKKADILKLNNFIKINYFYTDSKNDLPTSLIADKTFWIKNGKIISK